MSSSPKVLFACSEFAPLIKTGGLADVCSSLPQAVSNVFNNTANNNTDKIGNKIRVVIPGYHSLLEKIQAPTFITMLELPLGTVTLCSTEYEGLEVLLVNHETFSNRPGNPYMSDADRTWPDNAFRFALFSQAVCEIALNKAGLNWAPDIVHCHDWQTGLVPALLSLETQRPATLFTIHNLAYQGNIHFDEYNKLNLPDELLIPDGLEFWGQASFIKGGLAYADRINTVSPSYAVEITTKDFGCGMEGLLKHRQHLLSGILNGVDTNVWDPISDPLIAQNYSIDNIAAKMQNKKALQKQAGLTQEDDTLIFCVISRLAVQKGIDVIIDAVKTMPDENFQLIVLGAGESKLQQQLQDLQTLFPKRISVEFGYNEAKSHLIEAGGDVFLMPSRYEPCGLNQMYSQRYGTLPLVTQVGGLADTVIAADNTTGKQANGFSIARADATLLAKEMRRAIECFKDKVRWRALQKNAMQIDNSWSKSAHAYCDLYEQAIAQHRTANNQAIKQNKT